MSAWLSKEAEEYIRSAEKLKDHLKNQPSLEKMVAFATSANAYATYELCANQAETNHLLKKILEKLERYSV